MYQLPYYVEKDPAVVTAFMKTHPFATVMGVDANGFPVATQVPLLIREENGKLYFRGHVMRKTDHHLAFEKNPNVLVMFTSPHTYVSASWYVNPLRGSTWNYVTVQAKGLLKELDETALLQILRETTDQYEGTDSPSSFDQLPPDYAPRLAKAIIGFEIEVTEINNVFKLSQDNDEPTYRAIISKLESGNADAQWIAAEMQKRTSQLFKTEPAS